MAQVITMGEVEAVGGTLLNAGLTFDESIAVFRKAVILSALRQFGGNQCKAARHLGIHRNTLHRNIRALRIDVGGMR